MAKTSQNFKVEDGDSFIEFSYSGRQAYLKVRQGKKFIEFEMERETVRALSGAMQEYRFREEMVVIEGEAETQAVAKKL